MLRHIFNVQQRGRSDSPFKALQIRKQNKKENLSLRRLATFRKIPSINNTGYQTSNFKDQENRTNSLNLKQSDLGISSPNHSAPSPNITRDIKLGLLNIRRLNSANKQTHLKKLLHTQRFALM